LIKKFRSWKIQKFAEKAVLHPADCQIEILEIVGLCDVFIRSFVEKAHFFAQLHSKGLALPDFPKYKADATRALEKKSLGVCPKCHTVTNGEQLVQVYKIAEEMRTEVGMFSIVALSGGAERFLQGKCRNSNCDCKEILVFWRPQEDKKATDRLAKMGIKL
jgi:hypothetical protein